MPPPIPHPPYDTWSLSSGSDKQGASAAGDGASAGGNERNSLNKRGGALVSEMIARQRQRPVGRPEDDDTTTEDGEGGEDGGGGSGGGSAASRLKGKKPPRVPKMKRIDGGGAKGAAGSRRGCKVS